MEINQLKPAEIVRDDMGQWIHPEYCAYINAMSSESEHFNEEEWTELERHFNIETVEIWMKASASEDDWEVMMNTADITKWDPIAPHGFFLIEIGFSEDDAYALFAREIREESEVA
ncbi:hypothetical protein KTI55_01950 [Acinetobacter ursingii]|uniref:hypothetical protein n=1 Tax=Acinetobacter ursingii TaxID=108980 RepID=UPI0021CD49A1|nr:hypothetical protein [Acinetobacter ursingii]MCU4495336.1 hypothetical protein [Acinetobacter ursingii]